MSRMTFTHKTAYTNIIMATTGCTVPEAHEIEDGIRTAGNFTALDHLTRPEIERAARTVAAALDLPRKAIR